MNKNMNAMDTTKFVHKAMEEKTDELIGALSDGLLCVKQARRAEVHLNEDGHTGLVRLMEIFCCLCQPEPGSIVEGWDKEVLEMLLTHILAGVLLHPVDGWEGLALCDELTYMMGELIEGCWFA